MNYKNLKDGISVFSSRPGARLALFAPLARPPFWERLMGLSARHSACRAFAHARQARDVCKKRVSSRLQEYGEFRTTQEGSEHFGKGVLNSD